MDFYCFTLLFRKILKAVIFYIVLFVDVAVYINVLVVL